MHSTNDARRAGGSVRAPASDEKLIATATARAALAGLRVHALDGGGGFIVIGPQGWTTRELPTLRELAETLRRMGVAV
jgi:hypothetical protein